MSKKQARIDDKKRKEADRKEKSARLLQRLLPEGEEKRACRRQRPSSQRKPRSGADPDSIMHRKMEYSLDAADKEGRWSWGLERDWCRQFAPATRSDPAKDCDCDCDIRSLLREMSRLTWGEIHDQRTGDEKTRRQKHHSQKLDSIVLEARKRWGDLKREEDELFRFRGTGRMRLWGFRRTSVFHIVWWDPDHAIYPVKRGS